MSVDDKGNEKDTMEGKSARELERISTKSRYYHNMNDYY